MYIYTRIDIHYTDKDKNVQAEVFTFSDLSMMIPPLELDCAVAKYIKDSLFHEQVKTEVNYYVAADMAAVSRT